MCSAIVLPRFEVTLEAPKQITKELDPIEGTVDATYVTHTHVCACIYTHQNTCMHTLIHTHMRTRAATHILAHIDGHMQTHTHNYMYVLSFHLMWYIHM